MNDTAETLLITGGLGYVGGRIANHIRNSSSNTVLRLMTSRSPSDAPKWSSGIDVVQANLMEENTLNAAVDGIGTVIHLAGLNEIECQKDPELALEVNTTGTLRLLRACHSAGVQKFVYFSTFHVYGPQSNHSITEETPTRPVHPYAITHRAAEDFVNWQGQVQGMPTLVLRLSNGYGFPSDPAINRWTLVFNDFCQQAVDKNQITIRSSGMQQRDFISLGDTAAGLLHLLSLPTKKWGNGLFNLGGECSLPIIDVARKVATECQDMFGRTINIQVGSDEAGAHEPVVFSIDKLKATGFSPTSDMTEEIRGTLRVCYEKPGPPHQIN